MSERQREVFSMMLSLVATSHGIISSAIEGKPIMATSLENYYGTWTDILRECDLRGSLISEESIDKMSEVLDI